MSEMLANVPSSLGDISREPHWHPYAMDSTERSTERNKKPGMRISGIALQRMWAFLKLDVIFIRVSYMI